MIFRLLHALLLALPITAAAEDFGDANISQVTPLTVDNQLGSWANLTDGNTVQDGFLGPDALSQMLETGQDPLNGARLGTSVQFGGNVVNYGQAQLAFSHEETLSQLYQNPNITISDWKDLGDVEAVDPRILDLINRGLQTPDLWPSAPQFDDLTSLNDVLAALGQGGIMMPIGGDDTGPVISGLTGGTVGIASGLNATGDVATVSIETALKYCRNNTWSTPCRSLVRIHSDWNNTDTDYKTYLVPPELHTQTIRPALVDAILDMTLIAVVGGGLIEHANGQITIRNTDLGTCENQAIRPLHCGGLLSDDGRTVTTAYHCIESLAGLYHVADDAPLLNLNVGESAACGPNSKFRLVTGAAFSDGLGDFPVQAVKRCAEVARVGRDVAEITLSQKVTRTRVSGMLLDSPAPDSQMVAGRRVLSLGFPQTTQLKQGAAGFIAPNRQCALTFATEGIKLAHNAKEAIGQDGYFCSSADSFQGSSGGPILLVNDDGETLHFAGVMARAVSASNEDECGALIIKDVLFSSESRMNLIATRHN